MLSEMIIETSSSVIPEIANSDLIDIIGFVFTIIGALTSFKWIIKLFIRHSFRFISDGEIRVTITHNSAQDKSDPMEIPWEMVEPLKDGNYPISVTNQTDYRLRFEAEFTADEAWDPNIDEVRLEDLHKMSFPGKNSGLIAKEFYLDTGGGRSFTFPFAPYTNSCLVTVTVQPILNVEELGLPHTISEILGDVKLKREKRYYRVTAEDKDIDRFLNYA